MSSLIQSLDRPVFDRPRLTWRRALGWILAFDVLFRERHDLLALNDYILRDIGVTRGNVASALRRRDEHLRLILRRGGDEL